MHSAESDSAEADRDAGGFNACQVPQVTARSSRKLALSWLNPEQLSGGRRAKSQGIREESGIREVKADVVVQNDPSPTYMKGLRGKIYYREFE